MVLSFFVLFTGIIGGAWMAFGPDEVHLPRERIQTLIDERLPYERAGVSVSSAAVRFEKNELVLKVDVAGKRLGQPFSLSATTVGKPVYRDGAFYFTPSGVALENIVIGKNDGQSTADRIRDAAKRYIPGNEGAQNMANDLAAEIESWLRKQTIEAAKEMLSKVPVYTLPDDAKGLVAKAVIGEVLVKNDELVITFTLWRLTGWVVLALLAVLGSIAFIGAMVRNPGMFITASLITSGL